MKDAVDRQYGIINQYNRVIECSGISKIGEKMDVPTNMDTDVFVYGKYTLKPMRYDVVVH